MDFKKEQKIIKTIKQGMAIGWFLPFAGPIVTIIYAIRALLLGSTKKTLIIWTIVLSIFYLFLHYQFIMLSSCC